MRLSFGPRFLSGLVLSGVLATAPTSRAAELKIPPGVSFERALEYANPDGQHLQLDLARPRGSSGLLPAVVCFHGGGLTHGSREGCDQLCLTLAQHGYVAVTATYRLAPAYKFPAALHDAKAAVRWLRLNAKEYGIDPKRIGATGGSAGGFIAHLLGVTKGVPEFEGADNPGVTSDVACVVAYFGPVDFTRGNGRSMFADAELPHWLGGDLAEARRRAVMASPLHWVSPASAPTLIVHGTADQSVDYQQSVWMRDQLKAHGVEAELIPIEGSGHGFKGADAAKADRALIAFFDAHLKPPTR